jgi:hypothetical protein
LDWWQIFLIVGGAVALGLGVGFGVNVAIAKLSAKVRSPRKRSVAHPLSSAKLVPSAKPEPELTPPSVPDLFAEIEYNRKLATGAWEGRLQPFVSRAWDNRGEEVHSLPPEIRNELTEAYSDMALANSITWLSTEMSRRSPSLDESYTKLRASVGTRLNRIHLFLVESDSSAAADYSKNLRATRS